MLIKYLTLGPQQRSFHFRTPVLRTPFHCSKLWIPLPVKVTSSSNWRPPRLNSELAIHRCVWAGLETFYLSETYLRWKKTRLNARYKSAHTQRHFCSPYWWSIHSLRNIGVDLDMGSIHYATSVAKLFFLTEANGTKWSDIPAVVWKTLVLTND